MGELSIKITIASRTYPLTVKTEEEESIRKAAKMIEANMKDLSDNYAVRDSQDLLAMSALQYASEVLKGRSNTAQDDELLHGLEVMDKKLGSYLQEV